MPETTLFVLKDDKKNVTRMVVEGIQQDEILNSCSELSRCFGLSVTCTKFENGTCYLMPRGTIKVPDGTKMRDYLIETTYDFFGAIYIKRDVLAHKKKMIISRLRTMQNLSRFVEEKQKITTMINYLDLEGWDGICDNEGCTCAVTIENVTKNLSLECPACLLK